MTGERAFEIALHLVEIGFIAAILATVLYLKRKEHGRDPD